MTVETLVVPLSIGIDIDDVLHPWYDIAHRVCLEAGLAGDVIPVTWRPYEEYGITTEAWWEALRVATHDGRLYHSEVDPNALEALWRLEHDGHKIHLVTARATHPLIDQETRDLIVQLTRDWADDNHVPYDTLTFTNDKAIVPTDVAIDDHIRHYDDQEAAGSRPYLVNRPWNAVPGGDHRRRVDSIVDFADLILRGIA